MMQHAYYDMAGHYLLPAQGVTLATLGVPGKEYMEVDPSTLPPGSVHLDNVPPGHATIRRTVPWGEIKKAVTDRGQETS